jgi:hypothetical protein
MRRSVLGSLVILFAGSGLIFAQSSDPSEPAEAATSAPAQPVAVPSNAPLPPGSLPAPTLLPAPPPPIPPPPGPSPLYRVQPLFPDYATLDGFATRFWVSGDYLLWWIKDSRTPALVTAGSAYDAVPGALGQSGTQVLFGGDVNNPIRSGARFRAGYWLTPDQTFGLDGSFFFLGGQNVRFAAASDGSPLLARPFLDANSNRQDAFLVAYPGRQTGDVTASMSSFLWGAEANARGMLFRGPSYQISLLGGFRFLDLHEALRMQEMDALAPQRFSDPIVWTTAADRIHTGNQFYGGQIGTDFMWTRGRFFVDILGKVALGASVQRTSINGWSAYSTSAGQSGAIGVGQLALPSNLGWYAKDQFAVVPEFGLNVGYAVTRHIRLTAGYTFLYWSRVFRPGDQVDPVVNTTEFSALVGNGTMHGPQRPNFTFKDSDFWAQGLNFGLEFRY